MIYCMLCIINIMVVNAFGGLKMQVKRAWLNCTNAEDHGGAIVIKAICLMSIRQET